MQNLQLTLVARYVVIQNIHDQIVIDVAILMPLIFQLVHVLIGWEHDYQNVNAQIQCTQVLIVIDVQIQNL